MALATVGNQELVTALWFDNNVLYAGVGSYIKAFDWAAARFLAQYRVFEINKIHGITSYGPQCIILWGGSSYTVVRKLSELSSSLAVVVPEHRCKDWIVDVCVDTNTPSVSADPIVYIQTAHNEVLEVLAPQNDTLAVHRCAERSILYSGKLFIAGKRRLSAAGTVFGGVVVWDLNTNEILYTFAEHEGSIFDVAWSPDGTRLASCSDDRAIYVWGLHEHRAIAQGWGHASRIWRLRFASSHRLVSVAEDLTARIWGIIEGDSHLCAIKTFTGHRGRNVWSCSLTADASVLATGGGDGRIMLWDLVNSDSTVVQDQSQDQDQDRNEERDQSWTIDAEFGGQIRDCAVSSRGTVAVSTIDGKLWLWYGCGKWTLQETNLSRVPLLTNFEDVFFSFTLAGQVTVIGNNGAVTASADLGQPVLGFRALSKSLVIFQLPPPDSGQLHLYDVEAKAHVMRFDQPMSTSIMTCAALSTDGSMLCIGTRKGGLALYDVRTARLLSFEPSALGMNDAVTAINFAADPFVIASSRSTEYGYFSVPDLSPLFKNRARRRGSVEGFATGSDGLLFWGFQNDLFNVWNASLEFDIGSTSCGGIHRSWGFSLLDQGGGAELKMRLCYVRGNRFSVHTARVQSPRFKHTMLQAGTHGREIRGLECNPLNPRLVAMGSEDTLVSIGWVDDHSVKTATVVRNGHISGIQSLHWDPSGQYLFTGAGQGELVMWEVKTLGESVFAREVSRMPSAPGTDLYELRVMDFSVNGDLIAVAYSDSSFRVWKFGEQWRLLLRQKYRECCLLNIDAVTVEGQRYLLISSTDGHLVVYKLGDDTSKAKELLRLRLHQSGIRDSALLKSSPSSYLHFSGGDDNALRCVEVELRGGQVVVNDRFEVTSAHSSSVTAVCVTSDKTKVLTTSADQKIRLWSLKGDLLDTQFSDVSDTGVIMEHDGHVVAGGLGLEFFDLRS